MYVRTCMYPIGGTSVLYIAHAARMLHQPVPLFTRCPLTQPHTYIPTRIHTNTHTPAYTHTYTHSYTPTYIHTPSHLHTYTQHTPTPTHTPSHLHCHTHLYTFSDPQISPKTQTHSQMSLVISYLCGSTFVNMTKRMSYHVAPFRSSTKPCRCPRQWQTAHYWLEVGSQR